MTKETKELIKNIRKQHGEESIMTLDETNTSIERLSTGIYTLDAALGGGIPKGRIVEIYGQESSAKTTTALSIMVQGQKVEPVALVDAEHAFDPTWAKRIGLNVNELLVSQPTSGEEALDIVESLVKSDSLSVVVVDSVAALTPASEIAGEMGEAHMGLQARMMSQAMRKLTAAVSKSKTCLIFINQLRSKIGVYYGCFSYDAKVTLANGKSECIGKIVNQKLPLDVLTVDPDTMEVKTARIIDWHDNGKATEFLKVCCQNGMGRNGRTQFSCTPYHQIYTSTGLVEAHNLKVGDCVYTRGRTYFNKDQRILALSQVLGDGSLRTKQTSLRTSLRVCHGYKQKEYAQWKESMFGNLTRSKEDTANVRYAFDVRASNDLYGIMDGPHLIPEIGIKGVAIWILDDGTFAGSYKKWGNGKTELSIRRWNLHQLQLAATEIANLGLPRPVVRENCGLAWYGASNGELHRQIAPYVPASMAYKLHPKFHFLAGSYQWDNTITAKDVMVLSKVQSITKHKPRGKRTHKFDLTINGTHNYLVDGCLVHNSPNVTTGGNALKYYASVRIEMSKGQSLKDSKGGIYGTTIKAKVVKNKVSAPFKSTEFDLLFDSGIDSVGNILTAAVESGIITVNGAWYNYGELKLCGREKARQMIIDNDGLLAEIKAKL